MRPLRDATPVLLVAAVLLFLLLAVVRLYERVLPRPPRVSPAEVLEPAGLELLRGARRLLDSRANQPEEPLFQAFRSPVSSASVAFSLAVSDVARLGEVPVGVPLPGVRVRGERVQARLVERRPLVEGLLPHTGNLHLEVDFEGPERILWRCRSTSPYTLVALGPPPPLGEQGFMVLDLAGLLGPEDDAARSAARGQVETATTQLGQLAMARERLLDQVQAVATQFVEYVHGFRHLGGQGVEPPELLAARWGAGLATIPAPEVVPPRLLEAATGLVSGLERVRLDRWGSFRRWTDILAEQRRRARDEYARAWSRWREAVQEVFLRPTWEEIGTADELLAVILSGRTRLTGALAEIDRAATSWAAMAQRTLRHFRILGESYQLLSRERADQLRGALQGLDPEVWRVQASMLFEGEGAASRCSQYLEGATGPFAREGDGVIFLDNAGGEALRLREKTVPGRVVLVATGDVDIANLGPRDSGRHRVVVQAGGHLRVQGRVRATLIALGGVTMDPDVLVVGGLLVDRMRAGDHLAGQIQRDPLALPQDRLLELQVRLED